MVEDITPGHPVIKNSENRRIVIPNAVISSQTIENSTISDLKICNFLINGISYDSSLAKVTSIFQQESMKYPDLLDDRKESNEIPYPYISIVYKYKKPNSHAIHQVG